MATIYPRNKIWWISYIAKGRRIRKSLGTKSKKLAELAKKDIEVKIERQ